MSDIARHHRHLRHAARLALRGHGGAEPNPLVGCVIVAPGPGERIVGWGYHRRCGEAHAEIHALCRAGSAARGATVYVTLEPCHHAGRTGPCTSALIEAGVGEVVVARRDPNRLASGGLEHLRGAGIAVSLVETCPEAVAVSDPFIHRVRSGMPWVTAKWAQTVDGRIATRTGESQWISNDASRRLGHKERGRVDVIMTGIGTVLRDDPLLTARHGRRRRLARRVVIDPDLQIPLGCKLIRTAGDVPTTIACLHSASETQREKLGQLHERGVELIRIAPAAMDLPLAPVLKELVARHDASHVLVEAGPGLLGRLFSQSLVNEAWVFIAPLTLGDDRAIPALRGRIAEHLGDGTRLRLLHHRVRRGDVVLRYGVGAGSP